MPRKKTAELSKTPPQNLEAEQAVLGGMLTDPGTIPTVQGLLEVGDFYSNQHKIIFQRILDLSSKGKLTDQITLADYLRTKGELEEVGGVAYIIGCINLVPSVSTIPYYCEIVKEKAIQRAFIDIATQLKQEALVGEEFSKVLEKAKDLYTKLALRGRPEKIEPLSIERYIKDVQSSPQSKGTGYKRLDKYVKLNASELIIIGARPRHGKTTFALNLLLKMAEKHWPEPFIFFSYEVNYEQLVSKLISILSKGFTYYDVRDHYKVEKEHREIDKATDRLREYENNLYLVNEPGYTVDQIIGYSQKVREKHGSIGAVFVDYIELIKTTEKDTEELRVADIVNKLRIASQELNTPVIALAQMNRQTVRGIKRKKPTLEGLRYSGRQEAEATTVLGLYNEEVEKIEDEEREGIEGIDSDTVLEVICLKNRYAEPNKVIPFTFKMKYGFIEEKTGTGKW